MTFRIGQTAAQQLILDRLAWHANKDDIAWPSVELLMTETPITSPKTISTSIAFWEKAGAITLVQRANQYQRSEYRLNMSASVILTEHPPKITDAAPVILSSASVIPSSAPVIYDPAIKEGTVKEPSIEPSVYLPALEALGDVQGFALTKPIRVQIDQWLKEHDISPDLAETTANAMAGKLEYRRGKWWLGKTSYSGIPRTYYSWLKRGQSDRVNGRHPADRGLITQADIERTQAEDRVRPPPAKVNS